MREISEITLPTFKFWGGAKNNADLLRYDELEQIEYILEDLYEDGVGDTFINDLFWFDFGVIVEWLGYEYDEEKDEVIRAK
jgi:uncharacterized Rmd1/YagE family protein